MKLRAVPFSRQDGTRSAGRVRSARRVRSRRSAWPPPSGPSRRRTQADVAPDPSPRAARTQLVRRAPASAPPSCSSAACSHSSPAASWRSSCRAGRSRASSAPRTGRLALETRPPGAQVEIDGQPRGTTPLAVDLTVGTHAVTAPPRSRGADAVREHDRRRPDVAVSRAGGLRTAGSPGGAPHDRQRAAWRAGVYQRRSARRDAGDGPRSRGDTSQGHRGRRDRLQRADRRRRTRRRRPRWSSRSAGPV